MKGDPVHVDLAACRRRRCPNCGRTGINHCPVCTPPKGAIIDDPSRSVSVVAVAADLLDEAGEFVNEVELSRCRRECVNVEPWPNCTTGAHDEGRRLLAKLGVDPA